MLITRKHKEVRKPWGKEIWFANGPYYLGKLLIIEPEQKSSYHYHKNKDETFYVQEGILQLVTDNNKISIVGKGYSVHMPAGTKHSLQALTRRVILLEVSTYHPNDSIRVRDYYGRETTISDEEER